MEYIIETEGLLKKYGKQTAVNNVSLHVKKGDIYGLIGKNGAGKTTLMKLILGLTFADSGNIRLFGNENLNESRKKIGSLIEAPGIYPSDTAYENLKRYAILTDSTHEEILNILKLVGLEDAEKKKAGSFSLGMKQRLGIAIALLGNPEMLVLDEPVNGLDPAGIKDVRDTLLKLSSIGVTVLISSHLLDELGKIATRFGIMRDGLLVEELTKDEIVYLCRTPLEIKTDNPEGAAEYLLGLYPHCEIKASGEYIHVFDDELLAEDINKALVSCGFSVSELKRDKVVFEDFFIQRMG